MNASSAHCTCACRCADLCPRMCVYERVRLIEVVRVKIIPSGDVAGGDSVWGAAMGVGKERVRSGKTEDSEAYSEGWKVDLRDCFCRPVLRGSDTRGQKDKMVHVKVTCVCLTLYVNPKIFHLLSLISLSLFLPVKYEQTGFFLKSLHSKTKLNPHIPSSYCLPHHLPISRSVYPIACCGLSSLLPCWPSFHR